CRDLGRFLRRLEVGVRARGVVGDVDHFADLRYRRLDRDLDPLPERDVDLGATLAATAQLHIRGTAANFEQVDEATMCGDRGIDLPIEYLLDARRNGVAPAFVRVVDAQRAAQRRGVEVDDGPLEVGGAARLDQHTQPGGLHREVAARRILGRNQVELVDELAGPAARDRDPQAGIGMVAPRT